MDSRVTCSSTMVADYSKLFGNAMFSDAKLVIEEEACRDKCSQPTAAQDDTCHDDAASSDQDAAQCSTPGSVKITLPGHKVVLWGTSTFFEAKLANWSNDNTAGHGNTCPCSTTTSISSCDKEELKLTVPAGMCAGGRCTRCR